MADHYVAFSIPFFLLFIALESLYFWRKNRTSLRLNDSLTNMSCGIVTLIFQLFTKGRLFLVSGTPPAPYRELHMERRPARSKYLQLFCYGGVIVFWDKIFGNWSGQKTT
ncbi:hypothetical protein [Marinobacter sp.]|uniref:hypothetical protein n=1 Tax=Marinobacter sp. TaxID=50741 RepID=UPI003A8E5C7D